MIVFQSSSQSLNWEDGVSVASSLSGAEEKTVKAVCEQLNVNCGRPFNDLVCIFLLLL